MIPDAAVEAAAHTVRLAAWGHITPEEAAKQILEAAAPHMLAAAWDEGATGGLSWDENLGEDFKTPNPYRTIK